MSKETASGRPAVNPETSPVPDSTKYPDGQHVDHWVMSAEERARGFVRPVRLSYRHVGIRPTYPLRDLTPDERARFFDRGVSPYVKFEEYPPGTRGSATGRFWTEAELASGCGTVTSMPRSIAETYAANPRFYGSTFCVTCRTYPRVGADGEFVWEGTNERVGT